MWYNTIGLSGILSPDWWHTLKVCSGSCLFIFGCHPVHAAGSKEGGAIRLIKPSENKNINTVKTAGQKFKKETGVKTVAASIRKPILTIILIGIIAISVVGGAFVIYVIQFVKPYDINLSDAKLKFTSTVYADNPSGGNPTAIAELSGDENRIWVKLAEVPKNLTNAIISTEDKGFYTNDGVDYKRTLVAAANVVFHFYKTNEGGSTITQQVVKNLEGNVNDRTYGIKIKEIITALNVEKQYSKNQIMESYVNIITLGNGCYGVQTASNLYFGKDVKDLDLAQCASLTGIIQSPNLTYDPYKHPANVQERRDLVLRNMLKQGMITKAQYTEAVSEKVTYIPKKTVARSWFVDQVITDVTNDLVSQKGYTQEYAQNLIFTQGLQIYTTENPTIQLKKLCTARSKLRSWWARYRLPLASRPRPSPR
jgi:penicillin-binding protein 1A